MEKNKISIVVPCFNEKEALPLFYNKIIWVLNQMSQASETSGLSYELIIVDDGSMDGTLDVAKELATIDSVTQTTTHFVMRRYKEMDVMLENGDKDDRGQLFI